MRLCVEVFVQSPITLPDKIFDSRDRWAYEAVRIVAVHLEVNISETTRVECILLFEGVEIKRLEQMKSSVIGRGASNYEVTPHNTTTPIPVRETETTSDMLREYLLHIFQCDTPEERAKILMGITSKFRLMERQIFIA